MPLKLTKKMDESSRLRAIEEGMGFVYVWVRSGDRRSKETARKSLVVRPFRRGRNASSALIGGSTKLTCKGGWMLEDSAKVEGLDVYAFKGAKAFRDVFVKKCVRPALAGIRKRVKRDSGSVSLEIRYTARHLPTFRA